MIYFFLVLLVMLLFFQFYSNRKLKNINKHDKILFFFCDHRRDIMKYLRKDGFNISLKEFKEIKQILSITSNSIHYFDTHKTTTFNFRVMKKLIIEGKKNIEKVRIIPSDNEKIQAFQFEFVNNYLMVVFTFTPFMKPRFRFYIIFSLLKLVIKIGKLGIKIGIEKAKEAIKYLLWYENEYKLAKI